MPRSYSNDLRERVAAAAAKRPCREVASLFEVSVASVVKWSQRLRATGSAAAKPQGGRPGRSPLVPYREWLLERIKAPGMTVRSLTIELRDRGIVVDHVSVWRLLKGAGFSFKKNVIRKRAGPAGRRATA
jgi:transposase